MLRRLGILMVVLGMTMNWASTADAQAGDGSDSSEYLIKAGFIYNFAKFVEWPPSSFSDASAPLRICVLGRDPFGEELRNIIMQKRVGGRTLEVDQVVDPKECK